ncbi:MAG: hypothetical protein K9K80_01525, partial [Spirochaetia bacterium]|nr:hypothetical protein [Spirochaetia bacterium]
MEKGRFQTAVSLFIFLFAPIFIMQIGFSALDAADKTSWENDSVLFYFASSDSGFRLYDSSGAFVMNTAQQGIINENWIIQTLDSTSVEIETYAGTQRC